MRIAIAGTGGLARHIGHYIHEETSHQVIFLSRTAQPRLSALGFQVLEVDYDDRDELIYGLQGIDTVISTVTGPNQLKLIEAAAYAHVSRFAPAEFEGPPSLRPTNDPLDRGHAAARQLLSRYAPSMQSTIFVCGILYERFQPQGLRAAGIGLLSGFSSEGDYIIDLRNMRAEAPTHDTNGNLANICLTAAQDIARFVTRAIDLREWRQEYRIYGHRTRVRDLVANVQRLRGQGFAPVQVHNPVTLRDALQAAAAQRDAGRVIKLHTLLATAQGRYDFSQSDWARLFPNEQPISFYDWYARLWALGR